MKTSQRLSQCIVKECAKTFLIDFSINENDRKMCETCRKKKYAERNKNKRNKNKRDRKDGRIENLAYYGEEF